ncbi:hypothetical protein F4779DRAFT_264447 [Xylariaceae sp. FL0662B]|nr:hypothetical protein F4779DRAFT_264447 [Xylariaceae sp. FL0662B]
MKKRTRTEHSKIWLSEWHNWFDDIINRDYFKVQYKRASAVAFLVEPEHKGMVLVFREDQGRLNFDDLLDGCMLRLAKLDLAIAPSGDGNVEIGPTLNRDGYVFRYIDSHTFDNWPRDQEDSVILVTPRKRYLAEKMQIPVREVQGWCVKHHAHMYKEQSKTSRVKGVVRRPKLGRGSVSVAHEEESKPAPRKRMVRPGIVTHRKITRGDA